MTPHDPSASIPDEQKQKRLIPASSEELLALAEERRDAILASIQRHERGVSVRDNQTFARFLRGVMPGYFPLPNLERLWNAAYVLGLPEVPPWAGEPDDSPSALERLGVLIGWLRALSASAAPAESQTLDDAVRKFLAGNPGASIRRARDALGASQGAIHKTDAWRNEMKRRKEATPAIRQTPFPSFASAGIFDAEELPDSREPDPADAADAAEESTDEAIWARLIDAAKPHERAALHAASPEIRQALIKAVREERSNADLQQIIGLFASQQTDALSEDGRGKKRRRSDGQS